MQQPARQSEKNAMDNGFNKTGRQSKTMTKNTGTYWIKQPFHLLAASLIWNSFTVDYIEIRHKADYQLPFSYPKSQGGLSDIGWQAAESQSLIVCHAIIWSEKCCGKWASNCIVWYDLMIYQNHYHQIAKIFKLSHPKKCVDQQNISNTCYCQIQCEFWVRKTFGSRKEKKPPQ